MRKIHFLGLSLILLTACKLTKNTVFAAKDTYWQQHVDYTMDIDVDVKKHQYKGKQTLVYTNNSPDDLKKVFYHLYFNAFQPGSQMDVRSLNIKDPDRRVRDRISKLKPSEIGYIKVNSLKQNGVVISYETVGTILEVTLNKPIKSGETVTLDMNFDAQVPVQIRRSGRNNKEGVALSMAQWYPKLAEYDFQGWHTPPYIAREFQGVWGDFDVTIHIDKNYTVGGSGNLQNPQEIGHGYQDTSKELNLPIGDKLTWNFKAPNVHDFMWAADPEYKHDVLKMENGIDLHFLYKENLEEKYLKNWKEFQPKVAELMTYFSENVGQYPYKQYSVIQGGDGGMEYAMATLISGKRKFGSLFGVTAHEMAHTWFQFLLASNESLHPWMDEGFTSYISNKAENEILELKRENPHAGSYKGYKAIVASGYEESLTTHADRYHTNSAYGTASYSKGNIFLSQLEYVIGKENVEKGLKKYFIDFSFKHPTPNDIKRSMEKVSNIHLDWYLNEWTQTLHTIDYGVKSVGGKTITLERIGQMPMPIDVEVTYVDGSKEDFNIPLEMMRGSKPTTATVLKDWGWAYPTYSFDVSKEVKSIVIDKSGLMADINSGNNTFGVKKIVINFKSFISFIKIGVKRVFNFSLYNYILFLVLLVAVFSFKQWKKILWLVISIVLSYSFGMILVVYGTIIPKIDIIRFLIPFTVFSLAIFNVLSVKNRIRSKEKYVFLFAIFFGFFNGLGSSTDLISQFEINESELLPIMEVALGAGASVFIIVLGLLTLFTLLRKIPRFKKKILILAFSIVILGLSIPLMFGQIFE